MKDFLFSISASHTLRDTCREIHVEWPSCVQLSSASKLRYHFRFKPPSPPAPIHVEACCVCCHVLQACAPQGRAGGPGVRARTEDRVLDAQEWQPRYRPLDAALEERSHVEDCSDCKLMEESCMCFSPFILGTCSTQMNSRNNSTPHVSRT